MTPEEFNKEFAELEKMIGYECPAPIKISIWAKLKDKPVEYLRKSLVVYKFAWSESDAMIEKRMRHVNS